MDKIQSMSENFGILRLSKTFNDHQWKMQNSVSVKISRNSKLLKGPVPLFAPARKKCNQMQCIYFCFLYILQSHVLLVYAVPKFSWPGKLLNFTEIHRKYYKKLSFSFGINLSYALWFEKIRIWFSSPGTTRGLTLLYISRYFSIYLLLFVLILSLLDCC